VFVIGHIWYTPTLQGSWVYRAQVSLLKGAFGTRLYYRARGCILQRSLWSVYIIRLMCVYYKGHVCIWQGSFGTRLYHRDNVCIVVKCLYYRAHLVHVYITELMCVYKRADIIMSIWWCSRGYILGLTYVFDGADLIQVCIIGLMCIYYSAQGCIS